MGIPVLLLRNSTDRQEVEGINMKIIEIDTLTREIKILLEDDIQYKKLCTKSKIYGEGYSSIKILYSLCKIMDVL